MTGEGDKTFFPFFCKHQGYCTLRQTHKKKLVDRDLTFPRLSFSCDFLCPRAFDPKRTTQLAADPTRDDPSFGAVSLAHSVATSISPPRLKRSNGFFNGTTCRGSLPFVTRSTRQRSIIRALASKSGRGRGLETRREKGLCACLFRAKKSLKRRGTVGSAAANPHNGRIVRNGSTNLRVIYVLITGLQRGRARFAHVPLPPLLSASHNDNNGGKTDTRACSPFIGRRLSSSFLRNRFPCFFCPSLRCLQSKFKVIISVERKRESRNCISRGKRGKNGTIS